MSQADVKIALLIDADNSPATKIDVILSELAKYGVVYIRRAYGNWKSPNLKSWEDVLHEYAIQPIQQFDYSKGKNATDIALVIDTMDLLYTQKLDGFGIVSSDSDFTPLIMRIHTQGLKVFGFGEKKTPQPFVNACSKFTYLEALGILNEESEIASPSPILTTNVATVLPATTQTNPKPPLSIKSDTKLMNLLRSAVDAKVGENGWALLSAIGDHISNQASFDCQNYGFKKLSDLINACDLFETAEKQKGTIIVRHRQKKQFIAATISLPKPVTALEHFSIKKQAESLPLKDKYISILKSKSWEMLSKNSLINFYYVMINIPFEKKETLITHALKCRPFSIEAEAKITYNILWKAQLFKVLPDSSDNKIIILTEYEDFLNKIDKAMLSRLIKGCQEQKVEIDSKALSNLLYQDYEQEQLSIMIERLKLDINNAYN